MAMRMQELAERTGLPRTTIHHYTRESLLPPARKTAPNAAEYGEEHVERLDLITRLRNGALGTLSIPEIRLVLEHVEAGSEVRTAMRLIEAGIEARDVLRQDDTADRPPENAGPGDLLVARATDAVCSESAITAADLEPLADMIREIGAYSRTLVALQEAHEGDADDADDRMRRLHEGLAEVCDAMLWRAFEP